MLPSPGAQTVRGQCAVLILITGNRINGKAVNWSGRRLVLVIPKELRIHPYSFPS